MARPATSKVKLKEGYYIEVRSQGATSGVKIRRDSIDGIRRAIQIYEQAYEVHYIGKIENGKVVSTAKV
jgi:hypothetical protein